MSRAAEAQVLDLFRRALDVPPGERSAFVERECGSDERLRSSVSDLLDRADKETQGSIWTRRAPGIRFDFPEPGQAAPDPAAPAVERPLAEPKPLGSYSLLAIRGQGGMGIVYRARQQHPNRDVAIKVIRPDLLDDWHLRRFRREADILGQLEHPGIARVYEAGVVETDQGRSPFLAMEFVEGRRLTRYASDEKLDAAARLRLLVSVCDAVHHAHERGVVHRDLKPENILVDRDGRPRIIDFGIARTEGGGPSTLVTRTGQLLGTLPYMSPEQFGGAPGLTDRRSDVYSLGVIAYEILSGRLPLDLSGLSLPEAAQVVRERTPAPLFATDRRLRGDLHTIVAKAMAKEKERRYATARELADDIERYLRSEPIVARPASALYHFRKFTARKRVLVAGVAAVFLSLVGGVIATTRKAVEATTERRRVEETSARLHMTLARLESRSGRWDTALAHYEEAMRAGYPDEIEIAVGRIEALQGMFEDDRALAELETLVARQDLGRHEGKVLLLEGIRAANGLDRLDAATSLVERALAAGGLSEADAAFGRSLLASDLPECRREIEAALRHDPTHLQAHIAIITILTVLGDLDAAGARIGSFRTVYPEDDRGFVFEAIWNVLRGRPEESSRLLAALEESEAHEARLLLSIVQILFPIVEDLDALWTRYFVAPDDESAQIPLGSLVTLGFRASLAMASFESWQHGAKGSTGLRLQFAFPPSLSRECQQLAASLIPVVLKPELPDEAEREDAARRLSELHSKCPIALFGILAAAAERGLNRFASAERRFLEAADASSLFRIERTALLGALSCQRTQYLHPDKTESDPADARRRARVTLDRLARIDTLENDECRFLWRIATELDHVSAAAEFAARVLRAAPDDAEAKEALRNVASRLR